MNKTVAKEWLNKAWHHLGSGKILYEANHYTDTIAIDLHYAVEITLKSFLAYENKKIIKSHDLIEIHALMQDKISFTDNELELMDIISTYHIKSSYPSIDRKLPSRENIKEALDFAEELLDKACKIMDIDEEEVMR